MLLFVRWPTGRRFDRLPDDLGHLSALGCLDVSGNRLRDLPPSTGRLHQLRILNLSDNGFVAYFTPSSKIFFYPRDAILPRTLAMALCLSVSSVN